MIKDLILMNYAAVMLIVCLLIFIVTNDYFHKRIRKLFIVACLLILTLIVVDSVEYWTASLDNITNLRVLMSALGYTLRPSIIFIIILLLNTDKKIMRFLILPLILNTIIAFSVFFNDIAYSYTIDNKFIRGPIGYFTFVTSGFYLIVLLICTIKFYKMANISEMMISIIVIILIVISTILESVGKYEGMINTTGAITLVFYYIYLNTQQFKRDTLTGALNRRCFYLDSKKKFGSISAIISADLNNLKYWNDTFGHDKGDNAIQTVANCILKSLIRGCTLYRIGGDEFIILCINKHKSEVEEIINNIKASISNTEYSCAIGVAYKKENETFKEIYSRADKEMYANKNKMKKTIGDNKDED